VDQRRFRVLGFGYDKVDNNYAPLKVDGMTMPEVHDAIKKRLELTANQADVSISLVKIAAQQTIAGEHLVGPDGTVNLGAYGLIIVPPNWNGSLFIYAHGYSADQRLITPFPPDLTIGNFLDGRVNMLFQATLIPTLQGYASATTTFRTPGWNVKDSIKDVENLRRYFVKKYGKPKHTYLWGHSGGGMVTSTIIEVLPNTYDGALPMGGPGAGARRNFDGALDLRLLYEYTCGGVPDARFACRV